MGKFGSKFEYLVHREGIRINKYIPAVTKVEERTKEETGVGAAIVVGNQEENGI
jgi:hypothetical protein